MKKEYKPWLEGIINAALMRYAETVSKRALNYDKYDWPFFKDSVEGSLRQRILKRKKFRMESRAIKATCTALQFLKKSCMEISNINFLKSYSRNDQKFDQIINAYISYIPVELLYKHFYYEIIENLYTKATGSLITFEHVEEKMTEILSCFIASLNATLAQRLIEFFFKEFILLLEGILLDGGKKRKFDTFDHFAIEKDLHVIFNFFLRRDSFGIEKPLLEARMNRLFDVINLFKMDSKTLVKLLKGLMKQEGDNSSLCSDVSLRQWELMDVACVLIHRKDSEARSYWKLFKMKTRMKL